MNDDMSERVCSTQQETALSPNRIHSSHAYYPSKCSHKDNLSRKVKLGPNGFTVSEL